MTVRIFTGKIEQVYSGKYHQEATEKGHGVYDISRVKSSEEDERGDQGSSSESDVVERVDSGSDVNKISPLALLQLT